MAYILDVPTFNDARGDLSVAEKFLPFEIKRFYYIYNVSVKRGGHRHHKTQQALICLGGECTIYTNNGTEEKEFVLNDPKQCLILNPEDWHTMDHFSAHATLLVFSSEYYDANDYIDTEY